MSGAEAPAAGDVLVEAHDGAELMVQADGGLPLARFVIAHPTGAVLDPPGRAGRLRMALEMSLRGTTAEGRQAFHRRLERLGASLDAQVGHDSARLVGLCLARSLPEVFAMATSALLAPADDPGEWRGLVDEAGALTRLDRDDDDALADLFMRRALFPGHPLGRPAAGEEASLAVLRRAELADARRTWGRHGTLVAMAGPIDPAVARDLAAPLFAGLATAPPPAPRPLPPPSPAAPGLSLVVVDRPGRTQVQLRVGQLATDAFHPDTDMLALAVTAFGGTFTSPLTQQVRDERGWSYVADADFRRRSRHLSPLIVRCAPSLDDVVDCLELVLTLLADLAAGALPGPAALGQARHYLLGRYPFEVASARRRLGLAVALRLLGLPLDEIASMPARWAAMDLGEVPAMLARTLSGSGRVATLVAPADQVVPRLAARFPGAATEVVPHVAPLGG